MCGIFGFFVGSSVVLSNASELEDEIFRRLKHMYLLSETRGMEASGIALANAERIRIHKICSAASTLINSKTYNNLIGQSLAYAIDNGNKGLGVLGHTRLVTNGLQVIDANNQPAKAGHVVGVHNGIILNDKELWATHQDLKRDYDLDTQVLVELVNKYRLEHDTKTAIEKAMMEISGETSAAFLFADENALALTSNTGSLYLVINTDTQVGFFASEYAIASDLIKKGVCSGLGQKSGTPDAVIIRRVEPGETYVISLDDLSIDSNSPAASNLNLNSNVQTIRVIEDTYDVQIAERRSIKRCSRCILPDTMPYIKFNEEGVCNYCDAHQSMAPKPSSEMERIAEGFRESASRSIDCIVAFSGGRDSSYSLHVAAKEFGLRMLAYTYDWGMVTDIARRNQALMCAELGIEHIWVSADIRTKRANIKRNVEAWLKKPHLGMIPLFMAGDKQYFKYALETMRRTGIDNMVIGTNPLEKTDFKSGFAGVMPQGLSDGRKPGEDAPIYHLGATSNLRLLFYYGTQAIINPSYLNRSLGDTMSAYASYYMLKHPFTNIFDFVPWVEETVDDVLINQYGWETAPDCSSTWRIGDGTAPFYNYIYHQVAGFSEFDTFRSNQIREGHITREEALGGIENDNAPRWSAMQEYCRMVNVNFDDAIKRINQIPKMFLVAKH